jgi:hypothetical protein
VDVTEVCGQEGQAPLGILASAVPPPQRLDGEPVTEVVQAWPVTVGWATQTDLPGTAVA